MDTFCDTNLYPRIQKRIQVVSIGYKKVSTQYPCHTKKYDISIQWILEKVCTTGDK
jgi:hypothetical protein